MSDKERPSSVPATGQTDTWPLATILLLVFPVDKVARWCEFQVKSYCIINSAPRGKGYQEAVIDLVVGNGWGGGGGKPHLVTILHRLLFLPKC